MKNEIERCEITGLPIIKHPEWKNIEITPKYSVSFKILGGNIILVQANGQGNLDTLRQSLDIALKIINEYFTDKPFVYIEDLSNVPPPTTEGRKYYIQFMKKLTNMRALIYFNVSSFMSLSIKLARKLNLYNFDVFLTKNYPDAVEKGLQILDNNNLINKKGFITEEKREWEIKLNGFSVKYEIINDNILHSISKGIFKEEHLDKIFEFQERIIRDNLYNKLNNYYFAVNLSGFKITRKCRLMYPKRIQSLYDRMPFKTYAYYGGTRFLNIVMAMGTALVSFKYRKAKDIKDIISFVKKDTLNKKVKKKKIKSSDEIQNYVDEFLNFLGKIDWEKEGLNLSQRSESHPFYKIYDAITLIKSDLDELYLERKKNEEEKAILQYKLNQSLKLEVMGKLAGSVAHDLNNVLSGIVSYPDIILKELSKNKENEKIIKYIERMKNSGQKAANIVQDILTLSRSGVVKFKPVNLNVVIEEYLKSPEFEKLKAIHPNINVEYELNKNLYEIMASPMHLSKTIMNLVTNAMEAISDSGIIKIITENISFSNKIFEENKNINGKYVKLVVSDNGTGISPHDIPRIFEPFYSKKAMGRSGTGLGMLVVKGTVDDHQGFIEVKSKKGEGTSFIIYLPVKSFETGKQIVKKIRDYSGKGEKILVIDDDEDQRIIAKKILEDLYYSVNTVSGGIEAIDYLKENKVDLIVLDMIMSPEMNGLETYKNILKTHPNQKAVVVSGFSEDFHVKELLKLGAGKYIKKPYTIEEIGMAVYSELNKPRIP